MAPNAKMFLSSTCPHCPGVLAALSELVKKGAIGELQVTNIEQQPEKAVEAGIRSVPWVAIGPFELVGNHTPAELADWAKKAGAESGMSDYLNDQLSQGRLSEMQSQLKRNPDMLHALMPLLADSETPLEIRLGIDAMLESVEPEKLRDISDDLIQLSQSENPRIRSDATWYLSLAGDESMRPHIENRLKDEDASVREIAQDALENLGEY